MKTSLFLLPLALLCGCSSINQPPPSAAVAAGETLRTLRFDEQGNLENGEDLEKYCNELSAAPQTVVVFMHGWHGNASPTNPNIQAFQADLAKVRDRTYKKSGRRLTGICLTWKAHTLPNLFEYPMYYVTRGKADRIAEGDGIAHSLRKLAKAMLRQGREHIIVTGHSMGARILGRVVGNHPELLRELDLVLLANSADNSSALVKTVNAVKANPYPLGRLPRLVWVTSAKDQMTGAIYGVFQLHPSIGHDGRLVSYDVRIEPSSPGRPYSAQIARVAKERSYYAHNIRVVDGLGGHSDIWSETMIQILNFYVLH